MTTAARIMNFEKILRWLSDDPPLSLAQVQRLQAVVNETEEKIRRREQQLGAAQEQLRELAKSAGFDDVNAFLAAVQGKSGQSLVRKSSSRSGVRKPYLDPLNPDQLYSMPRRYPPPPALAQRIAEGWRPEQLHYKNIAVAAADKGIKLDYDPVERYKELLAQTPMSRQRR